jgi:hypothetical protein
MILILEMMDEGVTHAPGNSQWTQVIAQAAPWQTIRLLAPGSHYRALVEDANLRTLPNVLIEEIPLVETYRRQVNVASPWRLREEIEIIAGALKRVGRGEPILIVFASACPTAAVATQWLARLQQRTICMQMVLHGFANSIEGWRSRNPVARRFDLPGLMARPPRSLRFLALEQAVAQALGNIVPAASTRIDVLPLPVNADEIAAWRPVELRHPIQVALVGQTTEAKGISPFLDTARRMKQRFGGLVDFHVIGRRFPQTDPSGLAVLASEVPDRYLTRAEFIGRLAPMHYVFLPLQPEYYRLSPSGALIDAITWLKPIIGSHIPIIQDAFATGGDIGFVSADLSGMQDALAELIAHPDPARYAQQVEALRRLRETRMPQNLVQTYRQILEQHFPLVGRQLRH